MKPRYTVGTVTGWPITETTLVSSRNQRSTPSTIAYVYDSAFCYRIVARFDSHGRFGPGQHKNNVLTAQEFCDELNAKEASR